MVYKKLGEFPPKKKCNFCRSRLSDEIELGEIANISDIYCHYFCLLLSNEVVQRGKDNQGILGFMPADIKKEVFRGKKLTCDYCKKNGATIKCWDKKCKTKFHLPCGLKKGSLHQFFGHFRSFCHSHKPQQKIPKEVRETNKDCVVCLCSLQRSTSSIWPRCCKPSALIHRRCIQRMAMYHGYYFKCPLCNDATRFLDEAKRLGIYIPEQDPSWEREENAFHELLDRTISCERGSNCLCDNGPSYSRVASKWKLERCSSCGGCGIHLACLSGWVPGSGFSVTWKCDTCSLADSSAARHPVVTISDDDEMEIEVDVETVDDDPPLMLPDSYFRTPGIEHTSPQIQPPVTLEPAMKTELLADLKSELPIIISDSDDDFEVLSISSDEDTPPGYSLQNVDPSTAVPTSHQFTHGAIPLGIPLQVSEVIELDD